MSLCIRLPSAAWCQCLVVKGDKSCLACSLCCFLAGFVVPGNPWLACVHVSKDSLAHVCDPAGFVVPGNPWDRLPTRPGEDLFLTEEEETNNKESAQSAPKLNGASLCESSDMEGAVTHAHTHRHRHTHTHTHRRGAPCQTEGGQQPAYAGRPQQSCAPMHSNSCAQLCIHPSLLFVLPYVFVHVCMCVCVCVCVCVQAHGARVSSRPCQTALIQ